MPTVKRIPGPYRFFFYSFDCNEPMHIHVSRERMTSKFWLEPIALAENHGFSARELNQVRLIIRNEFSEFGRHGMSIVVSTDARVKEVSVTEELITLHLVDGRVISVPLAWSWRLTEASPSQRANCEIIGDGVGVHWPDVDEDLSVEGMLHGVPARRPKKLN
jgi:hypothetical protein